MSSGERYPLSKVSSYIASLILSRRRWFLMTCLLKRLLISNRIIQVKDKTQTFKESTARTNRDRVANPSGILSEVAFIASKLKSFPSTLTVWWMHKHLSCQITDMQLKCSTRLGTGSLFPQFSRVCAQRRAAFSTQASNSFVLHLPDLFSQVKTSHMSFVLRSTKSSRCCLTFVDDVALCSLIVAEKHFGPVDCQLRSAH